MKVLINCYGRDINRTRTNSLPAPEAVDVVKDGNYIYERFTNDATCAIHRIDTSVANTTQIRWTYGAWADKATLTYDKNLNEYKEIEVL